MALSALVRWNKRIKPKLIRNKRATKIDREDLKRDVAKHPDAYHYERARTSHVPKSAIQYALKRLNISYKKTFCHPKRDETTRISFQSRIRSYKKHNTPIIFIGESGGSYDMPWVCSLKDNAVLGNTMGEHMVEPTVLCSIRNY